MFAVSTALAMTLGLVGVFFVALPILVNILIAFIAAQVAGERQDNLQYERQHPNL
jgi:uncharacterized membrane protein YbaN (DUF454 family)